MSVVSPPLFIGSDQFSERSWLTAILDELPVGVGIFDPAGRLCHANRRFAETTGSACSFTEATALQTWKAFAADGRPLGRDISAYVEDAPGLNVLPEPTPSLANASSAGGMVVVENLDERRPSREREDRADARFKCFAEHSSNAILIIDLRTGKIDYVSPAAERIWGDRTPLEKIADWEASIHPDDRPFAVESRALVRQGLYQRFQYRIVDRDEHVTRHVRETSFPMLSNDGAVECIGGIVEDISPDMPIYLVQAPDGANSSVIDGLRNTSHRVTTFSSYRNLANIAEFLNSGCVIIDLLNATPAPGALMRLLSLRPAELQIILVGPPETQPNDIIDALKGGATDYLIHPVTNENLLTAVHKASQALTANLAPPRASSSDALHQRLASLSSRESEVFLGLVGGGTNKSIARKLKLSPRTVEVHRAHLMQRLNVRTLTELLHFAHDAGIKGSP